MSIPRAAPRASVLLSPTTVRTSSGCAQRPRQESEQREIGSPRRVGRSQHEILAPSRRTTGAARVVVSRNETTCITATTRLVTSLRDCDRPRPTTPHPQRAAGCCGVERPIDRRRDRQPFRRRRSDGVEHGVLEVDDLAATGSSTVVAAPALHHRRGHAFTRRMMRSLGTIDPAITTKTRSWSSRPRRGRCVTVVHRWSSAAAALATPTAAIATQMRDGRMPPAQRSPRACLNEAGGGAGSMMPLRGARARGVRRSTWGACRSRLGRQRCQTRHGGGPRAWRSEVEAASTTAVDARRRRRGADESAPSGQPTITCRAASSAG